MKAILQRVLSASVTVDQKVVSSIGKGLLVYAAIAPGDGTKEVDSMVNKVLRMQLWDSEDGTSSWRRSVRDVEGEVLCVSQFTLLASTKKGKKPSFHAALGPEEARVLYDHFLSRLRTTYHEDRVKDGVFQAMMVVESKNDGPVTIEMTTGGKESSKGEEGEAEKGV